MRHINIIKTSFFEVIFFLFSIVLSAQTNKIWTLEDCVNYAMDNNNQIKSTNIDLQVSENNYIQSYFNLLPNLNYNYSRSYNYGDKFNVYTSNFEQGFSTGDNYSVSSNITIFDGFKLLNTIKKSKLELYANVENLETIKNNITIEITTCFLNILYINELFNLSLNQLETTKTQLTNLKQLEEAQKISKNALLEVEAQFYTDEYNLIKAKNNLDLAYLNLYFMIGSDLKDTFKIATPKSLENIPIFFEYKLEEIINYVLENNSIIKSSIYQTEIAEKNIKIARSGYYPSISVFGYLTSSYSSGYTTIDNSIIPEYIGNLPTKYVTQSGEQIYLQNYNYQSKVIPYNQQITNNLYNYFGVNVSLPIFNNKIVNTNVQNSKLKFEKATIENEETKRKISEIITKAFAEANLSFKKLTFAYKMVEAKELLFNNIKLKYELGSITYFDFISYKNELYKVQSELIQAKYEYIFKTIILDFYMDKTINLR